MCFLEVELSMAITNEILTLNELAKYLRIPRSTA